MKRIKTKAVLKMIFIVDEKNKIEPSSSSHATSAMPRNVDVYVVNEIPQLLKGFPQMLWNDRINNYRYDDIQTIMKPILHIAPAIAIVTYVLMVLLLPRMLTACYGHLDTEVAVMDKKTKKQKKNAKGELVTKMKRVGPIPAGLMKSIMFLWNGMLCIMSVLIVLGCLPPYIEHIRAYGWWSTAETQGMLCDSKHKLMRNGSMNFWGFVFVISKCVTMFVVSPLYLAPSSASLVVVVVHPVVWRGHLPLLLLPSHPSSPRLIVLPFFPTHPPPHPRAALSLLLLSLPLSLQIRRAGRHAAPDLEAERCQSAAVVAPHHSARLHLVRRVLGTFVCMGFHLLQCYCPQHHVLLLCHDDGLRLAVLVGEVPHPPSDLPDGRRDRDRLLVVVPVLRREHRLPMPTADRDHDVVLLHVRLLPRSLRPVLH